MAVCFAFGLRSVGAPNVNEYGGLRGFQYPGGHARD